MNWNAAGGWARRQEGKDDCGDDDKERRSPRTKMRMSQNNNHRNLRGNASTDRLLSVFAATGDFPCCGKTHCTLNCDT